MKKLIYILFTIVLLSSCKKNDQVDIPLSKEISMSTDSDFINLMDAMNRFDPIYVGIVYRNKIDHPIAKEFSSKVNEQSNEEQFVSHLINQYHFKNKEDVLHYSTIIQDGLTKLFNTYLAGLTTKEQAKLYFKARKLYAKNKLDNRTSAKVSGQQSIVSMSFDMPIAEDDYYRVITEEQDVDDHLSGDNYKTGCTDVCCLNKKICINNAYINFLERIKFIATAAIGGGGLGFKLGSLLGGPQIGLAGAIIGGVYSTAAITAAYYLMYNAEKDNCDLNYRVCLQKA
jgi:hypothetical protein